LRFRPVLLPAAAVPPDRIAPAALENEPARLAGLAVPD